MAGIAPDEDEMITGINVTPFVDVVLVLLVIFMVTAKIMVSQAVPLDLPVAATAEDVQAMLNVALPLAGGTHVDGRPLPDTASLVRIARERLASDAHLKVVIHADGGRVHRDVLATLDALKQAGITQIAFAAQPPGDTDVTP